MERLSQLNPGGCSPTEEQRLSGRNRQRRDERTRTFPKHKTAGKPQPRSVCREVVVGVRRTRLGESVLLPLCCDGYFGLFLVLRKPTLHQAVVVKWYIYVLLKNKNFQMNVGKITFPVQVFLPTVCCAYCWCTSSR